MRILFQLVIIFSISLLGETLSAVLPLPIPASVYGIAILFALLELRVLKVESIRETSSFLIAIMSMLFVPAGVGLMTSLSQLSDNLAAYIVILVVSTIAVMAVSGVVTQTVIRRGEKEEQRHE